MYYIDSVDMTDAQLLAGTTLAEDTTSAWASGTYAVGDYRHVVATHRVYKCAVAGSRTISPELDPSNWEDYRPTNKWAPFDIYTNTAATATVDITYVLASRFCNTLMLRGLLGRHVVVSIKDAPGGATIYPAKSFPLQQASIGYWDYAYGNRRKLNSINIFNLPIRSNAEITITVTASATETRAIGLINRGKLIAVHGALFDFGGTEYGSSADPKTYTYRKVKDDGTQTTILRGSSKDISLSVKFDTRQADQVVRMLEGIMGKPIGVIATLKDGYSGLGGFGFVTKSPVVYGQGVSSCQVNIEGIV